MHSPRSLRWGGLLALKQKPGSKQSLIKHQLLQTSDFATPVELAGRHKTWKLTAILLHLDELSAKGGRGEVQFDERPARFNRFGDVDHRTDPSAAKLPVTFLPLTGTGNQTPSRMIYRLDFPKGHLADQLFAVVSFRERLECRLLINSGKPNEVPVKSIRDLQATRFLHVLPLTGGTCVSSSSRNSKPGTLRFRTRHFSVPNEQRTSLNRAIVRLTLNPGLNSGKFQYDRNMPWYNAFGDHIGNTLRDDLPVVMKLQPLVAADPRQLGRRLLQFTIAQNDNFDRGVVVWNDRNRSASRLLLYHGESLQLVLPLYGQ